jgi:ParB-like chromosome segregation protein Spo0J
VKFKIADIQPNPFRHMDRYPIRRDKVKALRESMRTTDFWDNVVARVDSYGKPQIAYGHHRLVALREEYAPDHEVSLIVRDLDDTHMLQVMARENLEEWGTSAAVEHETVRAVVEAYAKGQIKLPAPSAQRVRFAPSFVERSSSSARAEDEDHPYTAREVAEFLGWLEPSGEPQDKVYAAFGALEFIEDGVLRESDFDNLTTKQAAAVVEQARKARKERETQARLAEERAEKQRKMAEQAEQQRARAQEERERREAQAARARSEAERQRRQDQAEAAARQAVAAEEERRLAAERQRVATERAAQERELGREQATTVGQHVSREIGSGRAGYREASQVADKVREKQEDAAPPHIDKYAGQLAIKLNRILDTDLDDRAKELDVLVHFQAKMSATSRSELAAVLQGVADRALRYRTRLQPGQQPGGEVEGEVITDYAVQG